MKKIIIGALVGGIILMMWSFLAWTVLPLHRQTIKYSPAQDSVLKTLAESKMETGAYGMPMLDNRDPALDIAKYQKDSEKLMKENTGKPMAMVYYLKDGYTMDGTTILRGLLINLLAVLCACILLAPSLTTNNSFVGRWLMVLVAGVFVTACGPLIEYNWMAMPWNFTVDIIMDVMINWGIVGLWLAFYLKPKA